MATAMVGAHPTGIHSCLLDKKKMEVYEQWKPKVLGRSKSTASTSTAEMMEIAPTAPTDTETSDVKAASPDKTSDVKAAFPVKPKVLGRSKSTASTSTAEMEIAPTAPTDTETSDVKAASPDKTSDVKAASPVNQRCWVDRKVRRQRRLLKWK